MNCNVHVNREHEKLSQREELWQQVESLAKSNPEWPKIAGQCNNLYAMSSNSMTLTNTNNSQTDFDRIPDTNSDLMYDRLEQESRDVSNSLSKRIKLEY